MIRALRHLSASYRRELAGVAAVERAARTNHYPGKVQRGEIAEDAAQDDWRAWEAIARWCTGVPIDFDVGFEQMALAAGKALQSREGELQQAVAAAVGGERLDRLTWRRDGAAELAQILADHAAWLADLNAELRRRAAEGEGMAA